MDDTSSNEQELLNTELKEGKSKFKSVEDQLSSEFLSSLTLSKPVDLTAKDASSFSLDLSFTIDAIYEEIVRASKLRERKIYLSNIEDKFTFVETNALLGIFKNKGYDVGVIGTTLCIKW